MNSYEYKQATIENFIYNNKNLFTYQTIKYISENKPGSIHPRLLICGNAGTGKTHLLISLAKKFINHNYKSLILNNINDLNYLFFNSENIIDFWNTQDAIFIDDIQLIKFDKIVQQIIINLIDFCPPSKQLVLACLGNSQLLEILDDRLKIRILNGFILNIYDPDIDLLALFVKNICMEENIILNNQQIFYLTQNYKTYSEIKGVIIKIKAFASLNKIQIFNEDLDIILKSDFVKKNINHQDIIDTVSEVLNIHVNDILSTKRKSDLVLARQISMYICRSKLGLSYPEIGKIFGGKDHSTVIHSVKTIENKIKDDVNIANLFEQINSKL